MFVDCTTKSAVYNSLAAQGTWYRHVWGRRQYPIIDLDLEWYLDHFLYDNSGISLACVYGDPLCWPSILDLLEEKKHDSLCFTNIRTFSSDEIIFDVARYQCNFSIDIDGLEHLCGKVFLGANWKIIKKAIAKLRSRVTLTFYAFEHNRHQIPQVIELAEKYDTLLQIVPGCLKNNPGTSVISENYEWLYDVIPENITMPCGYASEFAEIKHRYADCEPVGLEKTIWGYTSLRTYLPVIKNRSINDSPLITPQKLSSDAEQVLKEKFSKHETTILTPDCKVFHNHSLYSMYMHMLATDWSACAADVLHTRDHIGSPIHEIVYCAQYFKENSESIQQIP